MWCFFGPQNPFLGLRGSRLLRAIAPRGDGSCGAAAGLRAAGAPQPPRGGAHTPSAPPPLATSLPLPAHCPWCHLVHARQHTEAPQTTRPQTPQGWCLALVGLSFLSVVCVDVGCWLWWFRRCFQRWWWFGRRRRRRRQRRQWCPGCSRRIAMSGDPERYGLDPSRCGPHTSYGARGRIPGSGPTRHPSCGRRFRTGSAGPGPGWTRCPRPISGARRGGPPLVS